MKNYLITVLIYIILVSIPVLYLHIKLLELGL